MLFSSFGHRLLLVFGAFVLLSVAILAAKLGLLGALAQLWVSWTIGEIEKVYGPNKTEIDFAAKAIGVMGTLLGAAWTVHKGWHYAERSLPERLKEFNERWKEEIEGQPKQSIPVLSHIVSIELPISTERRWFQDFIRRLHDPMERSVSEARERLNNLKNDFGVLTSSGVRCRAQVLTAHLELGSRLMTASRLQEALAAFEESLGFNRTNHDALELAARQAYALSRTDRTCAHLRALAEASEATGDPIRRARAKRFMAEVLKGGGEQEQIEARRMLSSSIATLRSADVEDATKKTLELSLAHIELADLQTVRGRLWAARTALRSAQELLTNVQSPTAEDAAKRLKSIEDELAQAERDREKDKDEGEEGDDDDG